MWENTRAAEAAPRVLIAKINRRRREAAQDSARNVAVRLFPWRAIAIDFTRRAIAVGFTRRDIAIGSPLGGPLRRGPLPAAGPAPLLPRN
jgi:hypothetical protein